MDFGFEGDQSKIPNPQSKIPNPHSKIEWKGAAGLAADVRYYGKWMRDEAERRIGHLYPKVQAVQEADSSYRHASPAEIQNHQSKIQNHQSKIQNLTVIAWLWARTVQCPNPACGATMPLVRSFALSTKKGKETWVDFGLPIGDFGAGACSEVTDAPNPKPKIQNPKSKRVRFTVKSKIQNPQSKIPEGTVSRKGAICICCNSPVSLDHVRVEGRAGRMGAQMMAIVAEGKRSRIYLPANEEHEQIAASARPAWVPETDLPEQALGFRVQNYGMTRHADLFTQRQLVALTTFSDLVGEVRDRVWQEADAANVGQGSEYANAVATYLALGVSKLADSGNSLVSWKASMDQPIHLFTRQAIPIVWDYAEPSIFSQAMGDLSITLSNIVRSLDQLPSKARGCVRQADAQSQLTQKASVYSTDPPYYDNVSYADLSDFFYVWLRGALKNIYPDLFSTMLVPKAQELVAEPFRHGGREAAQRFFEEGLLKVFERIRAAQNPDYPLTVYYAFKQAESDDEGEDDNDQSKTQNLKSKTSSTGWETMLEGLVSSGFAINGTWPMRTELGNRMRGQGSNALATSIILVCRPRPEDVRSTSRLEFVRALRRELPAALRALQSANIAPVDLAQAAIGPGMAIYSRHKAVLEADGTPMRVRAALQLINQALDEVLAEQEGAYDADTRWAIAWFEQFAFEEGAYGVAETLSKAKNTSVQGMVDAGVALARAGKVRLLRRNELPEGWLPTTDGRLTAWEMTQHLVWALDQGGELAAAVLLQAAPSLADAARDLAYRLYSTCERKKWAAEALAYNSLVIAWPEIARLAVERGEGGMPEQRGLFE